MTQFKFIIKDAANNVNTNVLNFPKDENEFFESVTLKFIYDKRTYEYLFAFIYTTSKGKFIKSVKRVKSHAIREWIAREFFNKNYVNGRFQNYQKAGKVLRKMLTAANKEEKRRG